MESRFSVAPAARGGSFYGHSRVQPALGGEGTTLPTSLTKHVLLIFLHRGTALFYCVLAGLGACSPGTITSHSCKIPRGRIPPVVSPREQEKCGAGTHLCPPSCRCYELWESLSLLHLTQRAAPRSRRNNKYIQLFCCQYVEALWGSWGCCWL